MKKKAVRAITGLLCAAMVFSHMAGMRVYAMEDGAGQEAQMKVSVSGNDDTGEVQEESGETGESGEETKDEEEGILYESRKRHNCVFVGRDTGGKARYAFLRGTGEGV